MTFMQAVAAMRAGKRVTRPGRVYGLRITETGLLVAAIGDDEPTWIELDDFEATDWEVVE